MMDATQPTEPGLPRFTMPAGRRPNNLSQATNKPAVSTASTRPPSPATSATTATAAANTRSRLRRAPFYPPMPPAPDSPDFSDEPSSASGLKSPFPLIMSILSIVVLVALLFSIGALLLGNQNAKTAQHQSSPTAQATQTTAATTTSTASSSTLVYQSSLQNSAAGWVNDAHCAAKADGYHITASAICYAPVAQQGTIEITVTAKQLSGPSNLLYGIILRNVSKGNYYLFGIDGNGKWAFAKLSGTASSFLSQPATNSAIKGKLNQLNTLEVKAMGTHFEFFVNGTKVGQVNDSSYTAGLIGLTSANGLEVLYANISIVQPTA